ncbi:MAG: GumC family protein [Bacteroidota bacterium]
MKLQFLFLDTVDTIRRRKFHLLVPFASCLGITASLPYILPREYESSVTILVENEPTAIVPGQAAHIVPPTDHFATMKEIAGSRTIIAAALDTLDIVGRSDNEKTSLVAEAQQWITTTKTSENIFRLAVRHGDPGTAQRMASLLAGAYITTSMRAKLQQQGDAVKFYEEKVEEYRRAFEGQQQEMLNTNQENLQALPLGESSSRNSLEQVETDLRETQNVLSDHERTVRLLQSYTDGIDDPATVSEIASLNPVGEILYVGELKSLSLTYSDLLGRYTPKYPEVQSVRRQMLNLLGKSREALEADSRTVLERRNQLQGQRGALLRNISQSMSRNEATVERKSDYAMYKELYDNMRLQLERAKIARSLGEQSGTRFVILDQPQLPETPTQASLGMFLGWGAAFGLFAGVLSVFLAEKFDPTIRRKRDMEVFGKPIIAYLP